jgi:hypothetical protein
MFIKLIKLLMIGFQPAVNAKKRALSTPIRRISGKSDHVTANVNPLTYLFSPSDSRNNPAKSVAKPPGSDARVLGSPVI